MILDLSLETGASFIKNAINDGDHAEFVASASVDHQIIGKLSGYVEFFSNFTTESHAGCRHGGHRFGIFRHKKYPIDRSCFFGVTRAAADFNPFAGIIGNFDQSV